MPHHLARCLTVGDGSYTAGETVTIKANAAPSGNVFNRWVVSSGNPSVANLNTSTTILTMPAKAVKVKATYKNLPAKTYTLKVSSGSGDGSYTAGETVTIKANAAPSGQEFDCWVVNSGNLVIANGSGNTFLTMPSSDATITATYKNLQPAIIFLGFRIEFGS